MNSDYSFFLFARPSFVEGIARMFDFAGTLNEYNATPGRQADRIALAADWWAIGNDLRTVMQSHGLFDLSPEEEEQLRLEQEHA